STDGVTAGVVVYRITPEANGCIGPYADVTVNVTPVPGITNAAVDLAKQICSGEPLNFLANSTINDATFTWTSSVIGSIGAGSVSATGTGAITDIPINIGNVDAQVTYRITPRYNGCDGTPEDLVVTVKPLPSATASDFVICSGQNAFVTISPGPQHVAGTTFSWTASIPTDNVTGATNGNGSVINQTLNTTDANTGTVVYTVTPAAGGCVGPTHDIIATVNPIATVV